MLNELKSDLFSYNIDRHNLRFTQLPAKWIDGLFLGNGDMGAMIWGDGQPLKISLDKMDFWEHRMAPEGQYGPDHNWKDMQAMIKAKNYAGLRKKYEFYGDSGKTLGGEKSWPLQPTRLPVPRLELQFPVKFSQCDLEIELKNARICGKLGPKDQVKENGLEFEAYIHAERNMLHIRITDHHKVLNNPPTITVDNRHLDAEALATLRAWGYPPLKHESKSFTLEHDSTEYRIMNYAYQEIPADQGGLFIGWVIKTTNSPKSSAVIYEVFVQVVSQENLLPKDRHAPFLPELTEKAIGNFRNWFGKDPTIWEIEHRAWWQAYWAKSVISIPDNILENLYYIELYKYACNCRWGKYACTLQGIWTKDGGMPPWCGDYHLDMNVQETYWPAYANNRLESLEPLFRMLSEAIPVFQANCRNFYGCDGILTGCSITPRGINLHGYYNTEVWPGNGAWAAHMFWLYWLYSRDKCFLLHKALPFMSGVMDLYIHLLQKNEYNEYYLPLSSSPEFHENQLTAWGSNTTCDLALIKWLSGALIESVAILKLDQKDPWTERIKKWKDIHENLTYYPSGYDGFWVFENQPYNYPHRHMTHLFPIHPFHLVTIEGDNEDKHLVAASLRNLRKVGDWEWTGWTLPWVSMMAAWGGNAWLAYEWAKRYLAFIKDNTMHINGDPHNQGVCCHVYEPMTLEAGFCFAAAIPELLFQSWGGIIRLFEYRPKAWQNAKFVRLRAEKAFIVSTELKDGNIAWVLIESENGEECVIKNTEYRNFSLYLLESVADLFHIKQKLHEFDPANQFITFSTEKDQKYLIIPENTTFDQTQIGLHFKTQITPVPPLFCGEHWFGLQIQRKNPYLP
jgi:alpha-L-fucosidase 2